MENLLFALSSLLIVTGLIWLWFKLLINMNQKTHEQFLEREMNMTPEEKEARSKQQVEYRAKQMGKERREMERSKRTFDFIASIIALIIILAVIKWAFATVFG